MNLKSFFATLLFSAFFIQPSFALNEGVQKLVHFETQANGAGIRSEAAVAMPHLEIPLKHVGVNFAKRIDPLIAHSLIFEKKGEKYVRWILNPEDTKWGQEVIQHFRHLGLDLQVQHYFVGYQTASRSYIVEDPISKIQFSAKSSTNNTGGAWRDKKQPVGEAIDGRLISDFLVSQNKKRPFENFIFMEEPAILKVPALDQAIVIRDLGLIKSSDHSGYYLPGFSALHETVGAEIALKNGSDNPLQFWTENYIKPAGRALGELGARTGLQFDSPHSQNFLVELDSHMKPTGRLVLRDMSDLFVDQTFMAALYGKESGILNNFTQKENLKNVIQAGFGPLHGNKKPSWVSETQYNEWMQIFFTEFESTFQKISGYDLAILKTTKSKSGDYFLTSYGLKSSEAFKGFYEMLHNDQVVRNLGGRLSCQTLFRSGS